MSQDYSPFQRTAVGLQIKDTEVIYSSDINKPSSIPRCDQSVIYYELPHMAPPDDGQWSGYEPVEGGGFFVRGGEQIPITLDASTGTRFLLADTQCTGYPEHPRLIALSITPPVATARISNRCHRAEVRPCLAVNAMLRPCHKELYPQR